MLIAECDWKRDAVHVDAWDLSFGEYGRCTCECECECECDGKYSNLRGELAIRHTLSKMVYQR